MGKAMVLWLTLDYIRCVEKRPMKALK